MSEEKFQDAAALKVWLITKGVDEDDAAVAVDKLFADGFNKPSTLIGITSADLKASGLKIAIAQSLSNLLAPKPEQQNGKLRCCSRIHFCIQLLRY
jgi:hypothetical protein